MTIDHSCFIAFGFCFALSSGLLFLLAFGLRGLGLFGLLCLLALDRHLTMTYSTYDT